MTIHWNSYYDSYLESKKEVGDFGVQAHEVPEEVSLYLAQAAEDEINQLIERNIVSVSLW